MTRYHAAACQLERGPLTARQLREAMGWKRSVTSKTLAMLVDAGVVSVRIPILPKARGFFNGRPVYGIADDGHA